METSPARAAAHDPRNGFTLVEVMVAVVVLIFGLMAVTNLFVVAATSTTVANQGTAASTSAARCMERLRAISYSQLQLSAGYGIDWDTVGGKLCDAPDLVVAGTGAEYHCTENVPGVGQIHTHWWITATTDGRLLHIRVRSEGVGALTGARSRAEFTTFRSCTDADPTTGGCPTG
jgi:prepilin-type N-terminal cleavage/methylation domain-containing protein